MLLFIGTSMLMLMRLSGLLALVQEPDFPFSSGKVPRLIKMRLEANGASLNNG